MSEQGFLFDGDDLLATPRVHAAARRTDPQTSHEAAQKIEDCGSADAHRAIIVDVLKLHSGLTSGEIPEYCQLDFSQVWRRMAEIEREGLIRRGEIRVCTVRKNRMLTWWPRKEESQ